MPAESFFEECQSSIERGHELWKSYFSKWENLAKHEKVSDSELDQPQPTATQPTKKPRQAKASKILRCKRNSRRKVIKKKRSPSEGKVGMEIVQQRNSEEETENKQLEAILKSAFTEILNSNRNKFELFAVLSKTSQGGSAFLSCHQTAFHFNNRFSLSSTSSAIFSSPGSSFGLARNSPTVQNVGFNRQKFSLSVSGARSAEQMRVDAGGNGCAFFGPNLGLKPPERDPGHNSPNGVCRKINKEYFIKRSFPEMNITLDGKRFRSLCLRKRTNSVSLSMENSNFITPQRKPSERKCFSENVSQRKRRRPSRVFFDNEVEDSESDDQTETRPPLIHSMNKKFKPPLALAPAPAPAVDDVQSDSDDCETIFDRVKTC